ncbi:MAG TPA: hypothetical protein VFH98_05760, partial [Candidatus Limnocylindria bacterium]|nr:hypothetical protein [Candidatus Limnocylindria bacterium]
MRLKDPTNSRLKAILMAVAGTAVIAAAPAFAHSAPGFFGSSQEVTPPAADDQAGDEVDGWDVSGSEDLADETTPEAGGDPADTEDQADQGDTNDDQGKDKAKDSSNDQSGASDPADTEDQADQGDNNDDQGQDEDTSEDSGDAHDGDNEDQAGDEDSSEHDGDSEDSGDEDSSEHD